jgi:hypothetical protein
VNVKGAGLASVTRPSRNGLPDFAGYIYRGTGRDDLTPDPPDLRKAPRLRSECLPSRVLEALQALGGEASTTEVRLALARDGSARPAHEAVGTALARLAKRKPPAVVRAGEWRGGRGVTRRWRLAGAGEGSE